MLKIFKVWLSAIFFSRSAIALWSKDRMIFVKHNDRDRKNAIFLAIVFNLQESSNKRYKISDFLEK